MTDLLDTDGENRAVRAFLLLYGTSCGVTVGVMQRHMRMSGFPHWLEWVAKPDAAGEHLNKAAAQAWLRHLFALEKTE